MSKHGKRGRKASAKTVRLASKPFYDREYRELRLGEIVVKRLTQASDAQELILMAFQEENWRRCLDDPLTGKAGQEHKQRLRRAVDNLNRRQSVRLLRFHVIRQGTAIAWELRENKRQ